MKNVLLYSLLFMFLSNVGFAQTKGNLFAEKKDSVLRLDSKSDSLSAQQTKELSVLAINLPDDFVPSIIICNLSDGTSYSDYMNYSIYQTCLDGCAENEFECVDACEDWYAMTQSAFSNGCTQNGGAIAQ